MPEPSPDLNNLNSVHLAVVGNKSSNGQFSVHTTAINIEPALPEVVDAPQEDPNAVDAHEWHDMLEDNVVKVVKTKRKQRNDSVSSKLLLHVILNSQICRLR